MSNTAVCTIVAKNYLPQARTLMQSIKEYHPEFSRFVLLADQVDGYFDPKAEDFQLDISSTLNIPKNSLFHFKYNILELNTAVKPYYLEQLFQNRHFDKIIYLDPDILLLDKLEPVLDALEAQAIALTPHLTGFLDDQKNPSEWEIMSAGAYNLGFIGLSRQPETDLLLKWWQEKLYNDCISAPEKNLFVDQRWADLIPGIFGKVAILRDPGLNVAYWNLKHREVTVQDGHYSVNGQPLRFFHFSGFDPENPQPFSKHQNRYNLSQLNSAMLALVNLYRHKMLANGYLTCKKWPYAYSTFKNGSKIPDVCRRMIRDDLAIQTVLQGAFNLQDDSQIIQYLNEPEPEAGPGEILITRLAYKIYSQRPDLQKAYPDYRRRNREEIARWFIGSAYSTYNIPAMLVEPIALSVGQEMVVESPSAEIRRVNGHQPALAYFEIVPDVPLQTETQYEDWRKKVQDWLAHFEPDVPVIIVPVSESYDNVLECLESLLANSPNMPILVMDDASSDSRIARALEPRASKRNFLYLHNPVKSGRAVNLNLAFKWSAPHDAIVVNSNTIVPPGWLGRLKQAAYFRSTIATVTPFSNNGEFLSIPYRNTPVLNLPKSLTTEQADQRIQESSASLYPIIPTALDYCTYYKRTALDAIGYFDQTFSQSYGVEIDFSQRAVAAGFSNVLADNLFVSNRNLGFVTSQGRKPAWQNLYHNTLQKRYIWLDQALSDAKYGQHGPLVVALETARMALVGYRIALDATCLTGSTAGTQVLTSELIGAVAKSAARMGHLTLIVQDKIPREALLGLDKLVDEVVSISDLVHTQEPVFDLLHRPFQVDSQVALALLNRVTKRFIVTQLDCIAYSNPSYFPQPYFWSMFRQLTQLTFSSADGIAFISNDAAQDAWHQGLYIPPERICVTYTGVDHHLHVAEPEAPAQSSEFADHPFILVLGTNYKHKNRVYAIRLLRTLLDKYGWDGQLVFAGPDVGFGTSGGEEALEKIQDAELQTRTHYLGPVSEAEKFWLMSKAQLVLYPSNYEGFGFIPFEAAAVGTPTLTTRSTSLTEVLGDKVAYLETLNAELEAEKVWKMLTDVVQRNQQVAAIRARMPEFTWHKVAEKTWEFYKQILSMPPRTEGQRIILPLDNNDQEDFEQLRQEYQRLQVWANELNTKLVSLQGKTSYRALAKIGLI